MRSLRRWNAPEDELELAAQDLVVEGGIHQRLQACDQVADLRIRENVVPGLVDDEINRNSTFGRNGRDRVRRNLFLRDSNFSTEPRSGSILLRGKRGKPIGRSESTLRRTRLGLRQRNRNGIDGNTLWIGEH